MFATSFSQEHKWDEAANDVGLWQILKYNANEWWIISLGLASSFVLGSSVPILAILIGLALEAYASPNEELLDMLNELAPFYLLLGFVVAVASFFEV